MHDLSSQKTRKFVIVSRLFGMYLSFLSHLVRYIGHIIGLKKRGKKHVQTIRF